MAVFLTTITITAWWTNRYCFAPPPSPPPSPSPPILTAAELIMAELTIADVNGGNNTYEYSVDGGTYAQLPYIMHWVQEKHCSSKRRQGCVFATTLPLPAGCGPQQP
jgi:hypothetical protein